jgi:hypothetical protein
VSGLAYLMEAATLANSMCLSRASHMHTDIALSATPIGIFIRVVCAGEDAKAPVASHEIGVAYVELEQCRVNPILDPMRKAVRDCQTLAYGRRAFYHTDPDRLP